MDRNKHPSVSTVLPDVSTSGNTPGYFTKGDGISIPPTIPTADWANGITEELVNTIIESRQTLDVSNLTQLVSAVSSISNRKNYIINSNFDFWQRGTSQTIVNNYGSADRYLDISNGGAANISRVAAPLGMIGDPTWVMKVVPSVASSAANFQKVAQRIENVRTLSGKTITVSFTAYADANTELAVNLLQYFGTGGTPSPSINVNGKKVSLTTTPTRYSLTFDVPSIVGKTLGTNGNDYLEIAFWVSAGSNFNDLSESLGIKTVPVYLSALDVHEGSRGRTYQRPDYATDYYNCLRYYQTFFMQAIFYSNVASQVFYYTSSMLAPMRAALPAIGQFSITSSNCSNLGASVQTNNVRLGMQSLAAGNADLSFTAQLSAEL